MFQNSSDETWLQRAEPSVSWTGIFAGAFVALAMSVFLTLLAAGFGHDLAAGGFYSRRALMGFTAEVGAAAVAIQVISAGFGGYLSGRLRHHWLNAHSDEAHFRDTAQGLITWAIATLAGLVLAVTMLTPAAESMAGATGAVAADIPPHVLTQSAFFAAIGMVLSAFTAAVAARVGGLRTEDMHAKFTQARQRVV